MFSKRQRNKTERLSVSPLTCNTREEFEISFGNIIHYCLVFPPHFSYSQTSTHVFLRLYRNTENIFHLLNENRRLFSFASNSSSARDPLYSYVNNLELFGLIWRQQPQIRPWLSAKTLKSWNILNLIYIIFSHMFPATRWGLGVFFYICLYFTIVLCIIARIFTSYFFLTLQKAVDLSYHLIVKLCVIAFRD